MDRRMAFAAGAVTVVLVGPGLAQAKGFGEPSVTGGAMVEAQALPKGVALQAGGGVTGFTRQAARDLFNTGGYWDIRAVFGTDSYLGAEAAYVGSSRGASAPGLEGSRPALLGNGGEANVRANLPLNVGQVGLAPYVFGGIGWTYYRLINEDANTSIVSDDATAGVVPFGAGLSLVYDHLLVDARFTYRALFANELVPATDAEHLDMQNWAAGVTAGYRF